MSVELKKIIMCGGDMRSIYMAIFFINQGLDVKICASNEELMKKYSLKTAQLTDIKNTDAVVFGLPAVKNDMTVNCPLSKDSLSFESILKAADKNTLIAGGRFSNEAKKMASDYKVSLIDYSTDEVFQIENAFYTAEGAVESIIKNTVKSLGELKILITGYGRITKALSKIMSSLGSQITVYARKAEQRAWVCMSGCTATEVLKELDKYDVIVNTVPHELFSENDLKAVKKDAVIIDLSARPGYVNKDMCEKHGIKLVFLPGLPAFSAPCSAGEAVARAIIRMSKSM